MAKIMDPVRVSPEGLRSGCLPEVNGLVRHLGAMRIAYAGSGVLVAATSFVWFAAWPSPLPAIKMLVGKAALFANWWLLHQADAASWFRALLSDAAAVESFSWRRKTRGMAVAAVITSLATTVLASIFVLAPGLERGVPLWQVGLAIAAKAGESLVWLVDALTIRAMAEEVICMSLLQGATQGLLSSIDAGEDAVVLDRKYKQLAALFVKTRLVAAAELLVLFYLLSDIMFGIVILALVSPWNPYYVMTVALSSVWLFFFRIEPAEAMTLLASAAQRLARSMPLDDPKRVSLLLKINNSHAGWYIAGLPITTAALTMMRIALVPLLGFVAQSSLNQSG